MNVANGLLDAWACRIAQQRTFAGCGHLLWNTVDGAHNFLVNKPNKMKHQVVLVCELYLAVQQDLFTLRGVHRLKSGGTPVPSASLTPFPPCSMLDVSLTLVKM